jgi:hypothetical protein
MLARVSCPGAAHRGNPQLHQLSSVLGHSSRSGTPIPSGSRRAARQTVRRHSGSWLRGAPGCLADAGACDSTPHRPIVCPADDGPHNSTEIEYWCWTGRLVGTHGHRYASAACSRFALNSAGTAGSCATREPDRTWIAPTCWYQPEWPRRRAERHFYSPRLGRTIVFADGFGRSVCADRGCSGRWQYSPS